MYTINGAILFAILIGEVYFPGQKLGCNKSYPTDLSEKQSILYYYFFNSEKLIGSKIAVRRTIHMVEIAEHDPIWERLTMSSSLIFQQFKMHLLLCNYAFIIFLRLGLKDHRLTFYMSNHAE